MKKTVLIPSFVFLLLCTSVGHTQIQSFEFFSGTTNSLSIPAQKLIKIYSLLGNSSSKAFDYNSVSSTDSFLENSRKGVIVRLSSGREISVSPFVLSSFGSFSHGGIVTVLSSMNSVSPPNPLLIPGPITIFKNNDTTMLLVYEVMDNVGSSSSTQTPSQGSSVVVPTSAAGDVDVKMEQSADNVTWTECLPGTYNSSTVKRFFRLRAVEK
jgi:hypothetical protein